MIGSMIASQIEAEMRREKYWKEKKRVKCAIDEKKQCVICKFQKICEDAVVRDESCNRQDSY